MGRFSNQVVLITGAGRGIGRALAEAFAAEGARVAANDLSPINLDETIHQIQAAGGEARDYIFDVARKMSVQAMIETIRDDYGRIDILINNAGVEPRSSLLEMDEWDWRRTLDVNLSGPFFLIQSAARVMSEQGGGVIVNLAASLHTPCGPAGRGAFTASKLGLIGLTREAARELAPLGIRVNAVCPEGIQTEGWKQRLTEGQAGGRLGETPLGRFGTTGDVAGLVLYLCSDAGAYVTGQAIHVNGGWEMN